MALNSDHPLNHLSVLSRTVRGLPQQAGVRWLITSTPSTCRPINSRNPPGSASWTFGIVESVIS